MKTGKKPLQFRLQPPTWDRRVITYTKKVKGKITRTQMNVRNVPWMRGKIVWHEDSGNFLFWNRKRKLWEYVEHGIFWLYRKICAMLDTHARELPIMEEVQEACIELHIEFQVLTKREAQGETGQKMRRSILGVIEHFKGVTDEDKQEVGKQLSFVVLMKDRRGEFNQGVLTCRSVTALTALLRRITAIESMHPWLQFYRAEVQVMIEQLEKQLKTLGDHFLVLYGDLSHSPSPPLSGRLDAIETCLENLGIKPYSHQRGKLSREVAELRDMLHRNDFNGMKVLVQKCLGAVQLLQCRKHLELAKLHVKRALKRGRMDPKMFNLIIDRLNRILVRLAGIDDRSWSVQVVVDVMRFVREVKRCLSFNPPNFAAALEALDAAIKPI